MIWLGEENCQTKRDRSFWRMDKWHCHPHETFTCTRFVAKQCILVSGMNPPSFPKYRPLSLTHTSHHTSPHSPGIASCLLGFRHFWGSFDYTSGRTWGRTWNIKQIPLYLSVPNSLLTSYVLILGLCKLSFQASIWLVQLGFSELCLAHRGGQVFSVSVRGAKLLPLIPWDIEIDESGCCSTLFLLLLLLLQIPSTSFSTSVGNKWNYRARNALTPNHMMGVCVCVSSRVTCTRKCIIVKQLLGFEVWKSGSKPEYGPTHLWDSSGTPRRRSFQIQLKLFIRLHHLFTLLVLSWIRQKRVENLFLIRWRGDYCTTTTTLTGNGGPCGWMKRVFRFWVEGIVLLRLQTRWVTHVGSRMIEGSAQNSKSNIIADWSKKSFFSSGRKTHPKKTKTTTTICWWGFGARGRRKLIDRSLNIHY